MNRTERIFLIQLYLLRLTPAQMLALPDCQVSAEMVGHWLRRWWDWGFYDYGDVLEDGRLTASGQTFAKELSETECDL